MLYLVDMAVILNKKTTMEEPIVMPTSDSSMSQSTDNQVVDTQSAATVAATAQSTEPADSETANEVVISAEGAMEEGKAEAVAEKEGEQPVADAVDAVDSFQEPEVDYSAMTREELYAAFEQLMQEEVSHIRNRVSALRSRFVELSRQQGQKALEQFIADGGKKEDFQSPADPLGDAFRKLTDTYRSRRQQYADEMENIKKGNFEAKSRLLDELRQLVADDNETIKVAYDRFNAIQDKWKAIGDVPREMASDLWQNYHFQVEQFFKKLSIVKELRLNDLKRNLEQKIVICEKAEELIVEESVQKATKGLQQLRDQWREIGPVPVEQNEEIWHRFCNASDQIEARRREFVERRKEEYEQNLLAKQALIDKVAELTQNKPEGIKEWNSVSDQLDELLKLWKSIGPVAREINEEVWVRFKGKIDEFYANKKEYFGSMRDEQTENYNRKVDLCLKAEAMANRDDWKRATEEIIALQEEWKSIGPVSRKLSDKVWKRFRGACDVFFARKGEYFKNLRGVEHENLAKKEELLAQLKEYKFGDDKDENLSVLKDFQRRWMEIGYVPMADKDRLQNEFRSTINGYFEQLKISIFEAKENAYREHVRNNSGDHRFANSERQNLVEKIEKMRADISLWENNLGFLSNSRSADLLKQEFEKKMQATRQQIALLEAKVRILDEAENEKDNADEQHEK